MAPTRPPAIRRMVLTAVVLATMPVVAGCTAGQPAPEPSLSSSTLTHSLVVGAPNTAEGAVIAELYSGALQAAGVPSSVKTGLGDQTAALDALKAGSVQILPAYTGDLMRTVNGTAKDTGDDTVRNAAASALPKPLSMLDASGAQNREVVAVTQVTAERYQLKSMDDLGKVCSQLVLAAPSGFSENTYGSSALESAYNCKPKRIQAFGVTAGPDGGPAAPTAAEQDSPYTIPQPLKALLQDDVQAAVLLSTDPAINDNALVVLDDGKKALLPEQIVPLVNDPALPQQARDAVNNVSRTLSSDDLIQMNRAVQGDQARSPREVALSWLKDKGIAK
ncbi:ABC transporter substrate-binding protein [Arthrobacter sp. NPDC090010]|uniref:ABC transporter substrate-binding protein n=1 Tax=Arthrobacter sp. NPDC090010 TaxID=3363942 RepID=UPI003802A065